MEAYKLQSSAEQIILGIDPGTQILGYSLLEVKDGKARTMVMDVLYLKKIPDFNLRIRRIFDSTVRIIDTFHPDHLAVEAPFFGKNVQSMLKLGRAQGVAIAAAMSRDLSYSEYEPAEVKRMVTGNGAASKEQVATMLRALLDFPDEPRYFDATDALAVAYTCFAKRNGAMASIQQLESKSTSKRKKPSRKAWAEYVSQNPESVN